VAALPDVLLSDAAGTALSDLQVIPEAQKAIPGLKVLMIGMEPDKEVFLRAVRSGAVGYLLKDASAVEVVTAVRSAVSNEAVCPPSLCLTLFEYVAKQRTTMPNFQIRASLGLTRREQQLVQMIGLGLTNKEIAAQLNLSEQTVKNHVHRMLRKAGASDRLAVVELCRTQGMMA
jgi:DNA-binding NarL/FixJ family response regulator